MARSHCGLCYGGVTGDIQIESYRCEVGYPAEECRGHLGHSPGEEVSSGRHRSQVQSARRIYASLPVGPRLAKECGG